MIISVLLFVPASGEAAYLLLLKNGGRLTTPLYWVEGRQFYFFYAGGVVGVEKGEIVRIEKRATEQRPEVEDAPESVKKKGVPPPGAGEEKAPAAQKAPTEKVNIADYKNKKNQLSDELDELLETRRKTDPKRGMATRKELTEKILNISDEIYRLTDKATEKNKGKLPEGWWEK
ncbi:MAG: hypothetical protein WA133_13125 [Syntrophales bacterium]